MSDGFESFSETSYDNWFARIGKAFVGALVGLVLFVVSFPLLYWNESRAVDVERGLGEARREVVSVSADNVDPSNESKLVHATGRATTDETLTDPKFGVRANALRLQRRVRMYQWREEEKREKRNKVGGGQETVTTYTYRKEWADQPIDSSRFRQPDGHANPPWPHAYQPTVRTAKVITLGAFTLSPSLVSQINTSESLPVKEEDRDRQSSEVKEQFKLENDGLYRGESSSNPALGDLKVSFQVVRPTVVSVIAEQTGTAFRAYQPKSASATVELLDEGNHSAAEMIQAAEDANAQLTWVLRLVGFIVMALGIFLVLNPLKVFGDVIPFVGGMIGFTLFLFAALMAGVLSLVTIAVSWVAVRPVLGLSLLAVAAVGVAGAIWLVRNRRRPARVG